MQLRSNLAKSVFKTKRQLRGIISQAVFIPSSSLLNVIVIKLSHFSSPMSKFVGLLVEKRGGDSSSQE